MEAFTMVDDGSGDAGSAGATQVGAMQQKPSVPLREHLARMFPHVVEAYHVTPFTEPAHEISVESVDDVVTNVLLRHAQRTMEGASIQAKDFAAFVMDTGYVAHTVDFVSGLAYGNNVHFGGFQMKGDLEPVFASQATLNGYLNSVPGHDEPAVTQKGSPRFTAAHYAAMIGGISAAAMGSYLATVSAESPSVLNVAARAGLAVLIAGGGIVIGYASRGRTIGPAGTASASGSGAVIEEGFYTPEIENAAKAHYANLRTLRDILDFKVTVTDTEMMDKLMRPFSDLELGLREELGYLAPEKREVEVQKRRKSHLDAQASLSGAVCLYMAVDHQLDALRPLMSYKDLTPPALPAPQAAAGSAGAPPA